MSTGLLSSSRADREQSVQFARADRGPQGELSLAVERLALEPRTEHAGPTPLSLKSDIQGGLARRWPGRISHPQASIRLREVVILQ